MVNQNKGKVYTINPVWDRKIMRNIIRSQIIKKDGYHNVNQKMSAVFKSMQEKKGASNNG